MTSSWRRANSEDRYAAPVEMRFIDMFMAALGALVFMAMLLAFLLKYLPPPPDGGKEPEPTPPAQKFEIVSSSLPLAQADSLYQFAFAYRGGRGIVRWEIAAGKGEIPSGMTFDRSAGVLAGRPANSGSVSFVVRAADAESNTDERPFTLIIVSPVHGNGIERWLAIAWFGIITAIWFRGLWRTSRLKRILKFLRLEWENGRTSVRSQDPRGVTTEIELPRGLSVYAEQLRFRRRSNWFLFLVLVLSAAFLVWRMKL